MAARRWIGREAAALKLVTGESNPILAIEKLAANLIDDAGFDKPSFNPETLASFRGVSEVRRVAMASAARLLPEKGSLVIEVNESHSTGKQNFSIDHEVSHTLIPTYGNHCVDDIETGTFPIGSEEEMLCDLGAAALLLDPRWIRPLAHQAGPSIATLLSLAETFGASLEATARQLASLDVWPCAFVVWEDGLRKENRQRQNLQLLPGFEEFGKPQPKLRVRSSYATPSFGHFVPQNKSVSETSLIAICSEQSPFTFGVEFLDLGKGSSTIRVYCENLFAPYTRSGTTFRRVISLLLPMGQESSQSNLVNVFQLEAL